MSDGYFVLEPDEAEQLHLGRTRWFGQRVPESDDTAAQSWLTTDEGLWQQARSIALLGSTLQDAGIDPGAEIDAGLNQVEGKQMMRYVTRWGWPEDWD